ncbi:disease resistance protein RUN1-like [Eucalyptus grandis]|uniref:disease resistance protein RUN1-like n=1 Tax=Eucalyptus grandis TaxID=71139 RepID=UPI00192ECAAC|nr:disease resistance protein RUN1-like [Eucalyptus grandis]
MAISAAGSSSDAAPASQGEYDVFLNFRGDDTRHGFTDFLYHDLNAAGVHVFRDEEKLPIGEVISAKLKQAIKNTIVYIPIFSETYASSKWCLRELKLMIDNVSESEDKKSILPIFFHVESDDVKLKKPLYEADLKKHEEDFCDEVEGWKGALIKVTEHKGWVVTKDQSQAGIVRLVVTEVLEKLKIKRKLVTEHFMGLDDQVKELMEFLNINHDDVRVIGIYGMGGIGKTTIAKVVFNQLCCHFGQYCSFLEGIRERSTMEGIVPLQKKLLHDIGGFGFVEKINDDEEGMRRIGAILSNKKVLVVLDDVDKKVHIKKLIGNSKLNRGCRIIITARDKDILHVEEFEVKRHEMQMMDDSLALRLFCRHAFLEDHPSSDYRELSREVVSLMGGLPLAIEVVGSLLIDKEDKKFWEETLVKLRRAPKEEIVKKLRISYNDLDELQKKIFLDIACFFFNEKKADAICMWESCEFCPTEAIEVLTNRCLIKVLEDETFWMHDQLIALGRQIVHEDSLGDFGRRSRFWIAEEALQIIGTEEASKKCAIFK